MKTGETTYYAYLLRLRRVDNAGHPVWRVSLESPGRGEQRTFADLEELFAFLRGCVEQGSQVPARSQETLR